MRGPFALIGDALVNVCRGLWGIRDDGRTLERTRLDKVQSLLLGNFQICIQGTIVEKVDVYTLPIKDPL